MEQDKKPQITVETIMQMINLLSKSEEVKLYNHLMQIVHELNGKPEDKK